MSSSVDRASGWKANTHTAQHADLMSEVIDAVQSVSRTRCRFCPLGIAARDVPKASLKHSVTQDEKPLILSMPKV
jgi:hypothetical protein